MDENSIGYVKPTIVTIKNPLKLLSGRVLSQYNLIYETYGSLNKDRSNANAIGAFDSGTVIGSPKCRGEAHRNRSSQSRRLIRDTPVR